MSVARMLGIAGTLAYALVAYPPAHAAQKAPAPILSISIAIDQDSAAARAARRWLDGLSGRETKPAVLKTFSPNPAVNNGPVLVPLSDWARAFPAYNILRLPFFYTDIRQVQQRIDGRTGARLESLSAESGWKLLAIWDAGMSNLSGNQDFSRLLNLQGLEFAVWEADPLQAKELQALDVWLRVINKNGVQRNAQQCLVDSRSTTPRQMLREHLQRIHLDLTLTGERYEAFVLAVPMSIWRALPTAQRHRSNAALRRLRDWERQQAALEQRQALAALHKAGMRLHTLSATQRQLFASRMPPWRDFLETLNPKIVDSLLATTGIATATGIRAGTRSEATAYPLPGADTAKR